MQRKEEGVFQVTTWPELRYVTYIRVKESKNNVFAKIHLSSDGERYTIHIGRKYIGFCRDEKAAIERAKKELAKVEKIDQVKEK